MKIQYIKHTVSKGKGIVRILFYLFTLLPFYSCSDWLDVRGENIQKEDDQFDSYKGFRDALTGCYMEMASKDIYGERLTMTNIEDLASLWYMSSSYETQKPVSYYLHHHKYTEDDSRDAVKTIYAQLFKTISSANVILKHIDEDGENITDTQARQMIEGEAYAIRAYCQLDVLRLFGQLPQGATRQVSLPYSETTSIDEMPPYYSFTEYVAKLRNDIENAETLLKASDPIFESTFTQLNNPGDDVQDDYKYYRQARLNYWAVRALHARMEMYLGNTTEAHNIATEIINAKGADGNSLITLSGTTDLAAGYNALPSECLFYLSKYDLLDYTTSDLIGGSTSQARTYNYFVSNDMLTQLYASIPGATASHNRYLSQWNRSTRNPSNAICPATKKYWYDESEANSRYLSVKYQIIPMLRLSEMYLIAMETSNDLEEIHSLYDTYMSSCAFTLYTPFESIQEAKAEMENEYRREFFAEGQMFYTYKRLAATSMLFNSDEISEEDYIVPLPLTEYDPDKK